MNETESDLNRSDMRAPHLPFEEPPFRMTLDVDKTSEKEWFEIGDDSERSPQMIEKARLLASRHADVFMADGRAFEASQETLSLMLDHLPGFWPDHYTRTDKAINLKIRPGFKGDEFPVESTLAKLHPLDFAARLVQEDLVIMLPPDPQEGKKGWWLAAASVAFPSRWNLKEKFGNPMSEIHSPVPFYDKYLEDPVNKFFDFMPTERIFSRRNWSVHDTPTLFQDGREDKNSSVINPENAGEKLWLRVERQTLRKISKTGAILFTIRIHLRKLQEIAVIEGVAKRLASALKVLPSEMQAYKRTHEFSDAIQIYLNKISTSHKK
jgi:dimethylamine monooxygenase subunit A